MSNIKNSFVLSSSDEAFNERKRNIFDQLGILENNRKNISSNVEEPMELDSLPAETRRPQRSQTKHFRGKESIFKKPNFPVPKNFIKKIPDFKKNPHKWTRYSLDDVSDEDMSEKSNTNAALSFLKDLETRKSADTINEEVNEPKKIIFKRSNLNKPQNREQEDAKVSFRSSKVVMPEYVVGQKIKKDRKNKNLKRDKGKELKLDHLLDDEDEQD